MKTAVSIPDELFRRGEAFAHVAGMSRSRLYREALAAYLASRDRHAVTQALDAVVGDVDAGDEWSRRAARLVLERSEW